VSTFNIPKISRPIRHLQRYRHILTVFTRHGFGFALSQLPAEPLWLRELHPPPKRERASLPTHFRQALEDLGPAFVKLGQMLSTRPDLLPPDYIAELSRLQDRVKPRPWEEMRPVLERELQAPLRDVFGEITTEPLASASLAQVYAAKLRTRQKVVIKVQRPNIQPTIKTDLEIMHDLAKYAQEHTPLGQIYDLVEIAEDFAHTLHNELDYTIEGRNADRFRRNFEDESAVHIPWVYWEHTTERVLVLEYIEGIKINNIEAIEAAGYDRERIANNAARMIVQEVLQDGYFHADPHPGNFVVMADEVIGAMDFGIVGYLSHTDRVNLIRLSNVAVQEDAKGVTDALIHIGAAPPDVDRKALTRNVERLLNYYSGIALKKIRIEELMDDVMPIAFEHHLTLPSNFWLLGKTLAMMEGLGLKLAPDFDIFAFASPHVTRLTIETLLPNRHWVQELMRLGLAWGDLLEQLPHAGRQLINRFENGDPIKLALDQRNLAALDRMVTRLALSLIISGMIIGLAWLTPVVTEAQAHWIVQAFVIAAFVIALLMGIGVLYSIVRKKQ
jgi:ubiquinone biosynthesis protein